MSASREQNAELYELLDALREEQLDDAQADRLAELLRNDRDARRAYIHYMAMVANLRSYVADEIKTVDDPLKAVDQSSAPQQSADGLDHPIAPLPVVHSPLENLGYFADTHPFAFSYLVATILFSLALVGGHFYKVEHYTQFTRSFGTPNVPADHSAPLTPRPSPVARITGMVDVKWGNEGLGIRDWGLEKGSGVREQGSGGENPAIPKPRVPSPEPRVPTPQSLVVGDRLVLASGLLQLTYNTGAQIILQGPCAYEVNSPAGGFLAQGKLTARVDSGQQTVDSAKSQATDAIHHSSFSIHHSPNPQSRNPQIPKSPNPLFTVTTPTATITDLGTEFGVEVDDRGDTLSHVFRGSVRMEVFAYVGSSKEGIAEVLRENESARAEKAPDGNGILVRCIHGDPKVFVRQIALRPKFLDLLDIVAGGNGTTQRREHGIDASTGMQDPVFVTVERLGDEQYHPVTWHNLIDGTFVPNGKAGPVVLDSAGHLYDGFPRTAGSVWGSIWARPADVKPSDYRVSDGNFYLYHNRNEQFMPDGRGLLCMHANAGITFNLDAMRKMYAGMRPARFHAIVGLAHEGGMADLWVFVDDQLKLDRTKLCQKDGVVSVDVELGPGDRFLTLATTDGGDGTVHDWVVFGDPVLNMIPTEEGCL